MNRLRGNKKTSGAESPDQENGGTAKYNAKMASDSSDSDNLTELGYESTMQRNRSLLTLLFQGLAITAVPFGEGTALLSAIYGGGPLAIFVGWIVVSILDECVYVSVAEISSRYPTSAGPYYWSYQLATTHREFLSFVTGWIWLIGNWTITLSVNFGWASLIVATVAIYHPDWVPKSWELVLVFWALTILTFFICTFGNRFLPMVDTICAIWTAISIAIICIALSVEANVGRHSASYALGGYTERLSGWGGFTFFIGLLPAAYTFSAVGMITSMSEEVSNPSIKVSRALALVVPVCAIPGLFFILPICFTLPPLDDLVNAPDGQLLPYIFHVVTGSRGGGLGLMFLIMGVTLFCSISITVAASRTTWAFARDQAIPFSRLWSRVPDRLGSPVWAMVLLTIVQMLLGLIYLGSSDAFTAFISVGVFGLAVSYGIPIGISLFSGRRQVSKARWNCGKVIGTTVNVISLCWIGFELILFSMPTALPTTLTEMNYASVVFFGFFSMSIVWYFAYARKVYEGPPASDGLS